MRRPVRRGHQHPRAERQNPYGSESVCFSDLTLGQEADNAGVSWIFYSAPVGAGDGGGWNGYQANQYVDYGSDWTNDVVQNPAQFLTGCLQREAAPDYVDHADFGKLRSPRETRIPVQCGSPRSSMRSGNPSSGKTRQSSFFGTTPAASTTPSLRRTSTTTASDAAAPYWSSPPNAKKNYNFARPVRTWQHSAIRRRCFRTRATLGQRYARKLADNRLFDFDGAKRKFQPIATSLGKKKYFIHQPLDRRPVDNDWPN